MSNTTYDNLIEQAIATAQAIGEPLEQGESKSHDCFNGYDVTRLVELLGEQAIVEWRSAYEVEAIKEIETAYGLEKNKYKAQAPVVSKRGKTKGLKGWVVNEMPSQYNESDTAYLVNDLHGEGGWVNGKSLDLRVPEIGELDLLLGLIEKHRKWKESVKRGASVTLVGSTQKGILLGFGNHGFSVAVQWEGMQAEEWVSVGKLDCPSFQS
jgi:hypothetical protein